MDQERRELERQVKAGDADALTKLQALNERVGPSPADISYLQKYMEISESVLNAESTLGAGLKELAKLNQEYGPNIGANVVKDSLLVPESLIYPDSRKYARCQAAKDAAKAERDIDYDAEDDYEASYIEPCNNDNCEVCGSDEVIDGWVPSSIC